MLCGEFIECLALFDGLYGHFCLKLGVVLFSCLLHGAKLLLFYLSTCLTSQIVLNLHDRATELANTI